MAKNTVAKNYMYNLIYQILVLILPLITTPYLSRILGAEGVGIYTYTVSVVTYFILLGSLGMDMYAKREIAYVQNDKEKRSKIFFEVFLLKAITLTISMILFYATFASNGEYSVYYKILLLEIIAVIFDISAFFQGMEEFKKIIIRKLIIKIVSIISVFLFIKQPSDVNKYLVIYGLSNFLGNISLWFYIPKYITKVKIKSLELKKHLKPTIVLFIPQIATQIYTVLDKTMLGILVLDKSEVGYYEQSQKIVKAILTLVTSLGTVMLPRIANEFARGEKKEIKDRILKSLNFVYFISVPMTFGLILVAKDLIPWFLGEEFGKSLYIIYLISPIILIIGLSNVIGMQYLLPTMHQKQYSISVIVGAIINFVLNLILIPKLLSLGVAISTVIAETAVLSIQFYIIRKEYNLREILFMSTKYIISAMIMFISLILLNSTLLSNISTTLRMGIDVITGTILYLTVLIVMKDKFVEELRKRILKK